MILHPIRQRTGRFDIRGIGSLSGDPVAQALGRRLDDGYHHFHDVRAGDGPHVGAVVVGPGGTWVLTRSDLRGRYHKRNGHWYRWNASTESWIPWDARPVTEARMAGHRLELYLERASLPATVEACLLINRGAEIDCDPDQRPGVHVHRELDRLATRIAQDEVLTPAQVDRIVALLDPRQAMPRLAISSPQG
jgi:hypothetical protein